MIADRKDSWLLEVDVEITKVQDQTQVLNDVQLEAEIRR